MFTPLLQPLTQLAEALLPAGGPVTSVSLLDLGAALGPVGWAMAGVVGGTFAVLALAANRERADTEAGDATA
jgi:hypothetical protein